MAGGEDAIFALEAELSAVIVRSGADMGVVIMALVILSAGVLQEHRKATGDTRGRRQFVVSLDHEIAGRETAQRAIEKAERRRNGTPAVA